MGGGGGLQFASRLSRALCKLWLRVRIVACRSTSQRSAGRSLDCGRSEKSHAVRQPAAAPWRRAATRALVASPSARLRAGVAFTRKHVPFDVADVGGPKPPRAEARSFANRRAFRRLRPERPYCAQACADRRRLLPVRVLARRAAASPREGPQLASARCVRFASCGSEKGSYLPFDVAASPLRRPTARVCSLRALRKLRLRERVVPAVRCRSFAPRRPATRVCSSRALRKLRLRVRVVACWSTLQRAVGIRRLRFAKDACAATKRAVPYAKEPPVCMDGVNAYLKKIDEISL